MQTGKPVAILGCGPAGLFAAQAAKLCGFTPVIISRKVKSQIYGAQYLHKPIPMLSNRAPDGEITTYRLGRPEKYAERVYGDETHPTSWGKVPEGPVQAWSLRRTYDAAWDAFEDQIIEQTVGGNDIAELTATFDVVISTIPLWKICAKLNEHSFQSIPIYVKSEMEYTGIADVFCGNRSAVVYNGTEYGYWYRTSYIFGYVSTESRFRPNFEAETKWQSGFKVVGNSCDCHPNLVRAGRMGLWQRGVLTHHAFESAMSALSERMVERWPEAPTHRIASDFQTPGTH